MRLSGQAIAAPPLLQRRMKTVPPRLARPHLAHISAYRCRLLPASRLPSAHRNDLCQDRQCNLFRSTCPDIQADGAVDAGDFFVANTCLAQTFVAPFASAATANRPYIGGGTVQGDAQCWHVKLIIV